MSKHILTTTVLFLSSVVFLFAQDTTKKVSGPLLKFEDTKQNFGFVRETEMVQLVYKYENKGSAPVLISDVKVTCGCTVVTYPKIIKPGEKGVFKVNFDTNGKLDRQDRTVTVISNSPNSPGIAVQGGGIEKEGDLNSPGHALRDSTSLN